MFTNNDILHYSLLLQNLNEGNEHQLPNEYKLVIENGGKDGIPHFKLFFNTKTNIYVIWVRGTDFKDPNDILINMRTKPIEFYGGCCHRGYFIAANEIVFEIEKHLNSENIERIICIGHSLGGAVSSIIVMILNNINSDFNHKINILKGNNKIHGLIFGTPPTFSRNICMKSKKFITNIILKKDIVPKLGIVFNSLFHFQIQNVTKIFKIFGGLKNNEKDTEKVHNEQYLRADYLPGKVVVIDSLKDKFIFQSGRNHSALKKCSEILGVFHHMYDKYFSAIKMNVPQNDAIFNYDNYSIEIQIPKLNNAYISEKRIIPKRRTREKHNMYDFHSLLNVPKEKRVEIKNKNYKFNFIFDSQSKSNT